MSMRTFYTVAAMGIAVLGFAAWTIADPPEQTRPGDRTANETTANNNQHAGSVDAQLAEWLAIDNQGEVAMGEFAAQNAQSEDVKQFAQMMVDDHNKMLDQLAQFYPGAKRQPADNPEAGAARTNDRTPEAAAAGQRREDRAAARNAAAPGAANDDNRMERIDFLAVKHELAQQCLQSQRAELEKKPKAEFDRCYVGSQIAAHMHALDSIKVLQKYATPDLRQILTAGQDKVQQHLTHAKQIMDTLERERVASRERAQPE